MLIVAVVGCNDDDGTQYKMQNIATPVIVEKANLRASFDQQEMESPRPILNSGKFYVYGDYIFINDIGVGIHVINNSNPNAPNKETFLPVPGSRDMEARDNILYVDSYSDLVLFDLSNMNDIKYLKNYEDILGDSSDIWPLFSQQVDLVDYGDFDANTQIVVDWEYSRELRPARSEEFFADGALINTANGVNGFSGSGQGGSFARFNIVNDRLYIINTGQLFVFDVSNQADPVVTHQQYLSWNVETIFNQGDYLYLGSTDGMHIYNITDVDNPSAVSRISHLLGCDPVVVEGDYAYVTVRGGNACGQDFSFLEVIDVSDKTNPQIVKEYDMREPYGLGIHDDRLFVSDGQYGLQIYDKSDPNSLKLVKIMENLNVFDVIPLEDKMLMIGNDILHQYSYSGQGISEISTYQLN